MDVEHPQPDPDRYRRLPDAVRLEDTVETVDTSRLPERDLDAERDRLLRTVG
jgi:hypothetical protein